jgi:hypothetical protein
MPDANAASFIGLGLTAAGLAFGLYQYRMNSQEARQARRRERAVMAVKFMKEFYEDTNVSFAMQLLDHGRAELTGIGQVIAADLPAALARHWINSPDELKDDATKKGPFTVKDRAIRSAFDGFLVQLESIEHLIVNGVIGSRNFGELFSYWLILLGEIARPDDSIAHLSDDARRALWTYIRVYQFNGVVNLFARYGRAGPIGTNDRFVPRATTKITLEQSFVS